MSGTAFAWTSVGGRAKSGVPLGLTKEAQRQPSTESQPSEIVFSQSGAIKASPGLRWGYKDQHKKNKFELKLYFSHPPEDKKKKKKKIVRTIQAHIGNVRNHEKSVRVRTAAPVGGTRGGVSIRYGRQGSRSSTGTIPRLFGRRLTRQGLGIA